MSKSVNKGSNGGELFGTKLDEILKIEAKHCEKREHWRTGSLAISFLKETKLGIAVDLKFL